MRKKREARRPQRVERIEFETFRKIGDYDIGNLIRAEPSAFNGNVNYRKYRVVIELIDEPKEVLEERIRTLWGKCENHCREPLKAAARELGIKLEPLNLYKNP